VARCLTLVHPKSIPNIGPQKYSRGFAALIVGLGKEPDTETSVRRMIDSGCDDRSVVHEHFQYVVIKEGMNFESFLDLFFIIQKCEKSVWS